MSTSTRQPMRTAVVGGGPGGLFYANLAKRRVPDDEVVVFERNPCDATFGFGVVFSEQTLSGFSDADPELHAEIARESVGWEDIEVRRQGRRLRCGGHGFSAISRKTLLRLLQDRAGDAGVDLRFECEPSEADLAAADLVLAADGVNSSTRSHHEAEFDPRFEPGAARFIWFATTQPFDALTMAFEENEHGHWGLHAYPYEDGRSTFIVETDVESWRRAGLDQAGDLPPGESDMHSLRYCEELFAEHLGGSGLLENNSKWLQFRTLRCGSWSHGNIAIVGDAAHTAHFSVGSGTKMAMEDSVALADAVAASTDIPTALASYEAVRRPAVERIQGAAVPSLIWWERFRHLAARDDEEFMFHFLTRSPAVTRSRLRARDFRFARAIEQHFAAQTGASVGAGPLAAPYRMSSGLELVSRLIVAPSEDLDPLPALGGAALGGAGLVLAASIEGARDALAWVRTNTDAAVGVRLDADATATEVEQAAQLGLDVLSIDISAPGASSWPEDRTAILLVDAPTDPEGPEGDLLVTRLTALGDRSVLVGIRAPQDPEGDPLVAQLLTCDRVRQEAGLPTVLAGGVSNADVATTAVLAGRADLVWAAPSLVSETWGQASIPSSGLAAGVDGAAVAR